MFGSDEFLVEIPWHPLFVSGCPFFYKFCANREKKGYQLLISNLRSVWRETLDHRGIEERNCELNPNIEASSERLLSEISHLFDINDTTSVGDGADGGCAGRWRLSDGHRDEQTLNITARSNLASVHFEWNFGLRIVDKEEFFKQMTNPLLLMLAELSRRQHVLIDVITDKDRQIADYRADGVKLRRTYKFEQLFDYSSFIGDIETAKNSEVEMGISETVAFDAQLRSLYSHVVKAPERKHRILPVSDDLADDLVESQVRILEEKSGLADKREDCGTKIVTEKEKEKVRRHVLKVKLEEEKNKMETLKPAKKLKL